MFVLLLSLSAIPNPFLDVLSVTAGVTKLPLGRYLPPVVLGKTIRAIILAYLGSRAAG
jgi:membrane protein YqaA with SNARE-associated domain